MDWEGAGVSPAREGAPDTENGQLEQKMQRRSMSVPAPWGRPRLAASPSHALLSPGSMAGGKELGCQRAGLQIKLLIPQNLSCKTLDKLFNPETLFSHKLGGTLSMVHYVLKKSENSEKYAEHIKNTSSSYYPTINKLYRIVWLALCSVVITTVVIGLVWIEICSKYKRHTRLQRLIPQKKK